MFGLVDSCSHKGIHTILNIVVQQVWVILQEGKERREEEEGREEREGREEEEGREEGRGSNNPSSHTSKPCTALPEWEGHHSQRQSKTRGGVHVEIVEDPREEV